MGSIYFMKRENSGKSGTSDCLRSLSMLKVGVDDIMPCDQIIEAKILPLLDGWIDSQYLFLGTTYFFIACNI